MNDQTPITTVALIPLDQLYLHEFNPRPRATDAEIESKASSISICGLMQNLMGYADPGQPARTGIVAGGLRLRALQKLAEEGWRRHHDQQKLDMIPVQVADDPFKARAWAAAENVSRTNLNPADEAKAFAAMASQGSSDPMIAAAFGVSERHVAKRLRLATLPDAALDALRAGAIGVDVARALTVSDDRDRQLRALEGGTLTEDLWGDGFLHDEDLLDKLFAETLETRALALQVEEGWSWVETTLESYVGYQMTDKLTRLYRVPGELSEADSRRYDELSEAANDEDLDQDQAAELDALDARLEGDFSDEDRVRGGILVCVDRGGKLEISRGWARKADATKTKADSNDADDGPTPAAEAKPAIPQNCMDDLARIRLQALQRALLDKPNLMLDLLAYTLDLGVRYSAPIGLTLDRPTIAPEKASGLIEDKRLADADPVDRFPKATAEAFQSFRDQGQRHRNTVLTHRLARAVQPSDLFAHLWAEASADIRKHWTPDAENFFSRVRGDLLDAIWSELTGDKGDANAFANLKRAEKAKKLEALFSDLSVREALGLSREENAAIDAWLPAPMVMGDLA